MGFHGKEYWSGVPIPSPIFLLNLKKKLLEKKMDPQTDALRVVKVPRSDNVWMGRGSCYKHPWWERELVIKPFQDTARSISPSLKHMFPWTWQFSSLHLSQENN